jgi:hypothetical protein
MFHEGLSSRERWMSGKLIAELPRWYQIFAIMLSFAPLCLGLPAWMSHCFISTGVHDRKNNSSAAECIVHGYGGDAGSAPVNILRWNTTAAMRVLLWYSGISLY